MEVSGHGAAAVTRIDGLHLVGTGSFALEVLEYAQAGGHDVDGLIELRDLSRIGTWIHERPVIAPEQRPAGGRAAIALGADRLATWRRLATAGWHPATVIHPLAVVSPSAQVGDGTVIGPLAVVGAAAVIGAHCLIGRGATVGHHVRLGDGVVVNPGANIGGNTTIDAGAAVGIGATVVNGRRVGPGAQVAAGATVVRDVPAHTRVQGVPARVYDTGAVTAGAGGRPA